MIRQTVSGWSLRGCYGVIMIRPSGVFCVFWLLLISNVISCHGLSDRGTRLRFQEEIEKHEKKPENSRVAAGECHDQADAEWVVIRRPFRGHNDTPLGQPTPGRPFGRLGVGHPTGVFGGFSYY